MQDTQDLARSVLYVVSDDGYTPMNIATIANMVKGGTKVEDISIFVDKNAAQAEYTRRCAANEVADRVKREEIEVIQIIQKAVEVLSMRNSITPQARDKAKALINLLNPPLPF